jgi:hypothetical protein
MTYPLSAADLKWPVVVTVAYMTVYYYFILRIAHQKFKLAGKYIKGKDAVDSNLGLHAIDPGSGSHLRSDPQIKVCERAQLNTLGTAVFGD